MAGSATHPGHGGTGKGTAPWSSQGTRDQDQPVEATARRGRDARIAATGVAVVLLVWFAVANLQRVHIRFWLWSESAPLIVVVVISCALGAALGGLASRARRRRSGR